MNVADIHLRGFMFCFLKAPVKDPQRVIHAPVKEVRNEIPREFVEKAFEITGTFEGTNWGTVSPNFDGQGISCGKLQWNYGQGSLQSKILQVFVNKFGENVLNSFFPEPVSPSAFMSAKKAIAFSMMMQTKKFSLKSRKYIYSMKSNWTFAWKNFLEDPRTVEIQKDAAASLASKAWSYIEKYNLPKDKLHFCFCFDVVVQNGGFNGVAYPIQYDTLDNTYKKCLDDADLMMLENAKIWSKSSIIRSQNKLLFIWINRRVTKNKWAKDVISRKGTIAHYHGFVHGKEHLLSI